MSYKKILPLILLLAVLIGVALALDGRQSKSSSNQAVEGRLFVATVEGGEIVAAIFDPASGTRVDEKRIAVPGQLVASSFSSSGANDAVQVDPQSLTVYFITQGTNDYDGSCANADGTCFDRLYAVSRDESEPRKLVDLDSRVEQWILVPDRQEILIGSYVEAGYQLSRIDLGAPGASAAVVYQNDSIIVPAPLVSIHHADTVELIARTRSADEAWEWSIYSVEASSGVTRRETAMLEQGRFVSGISPDGQWLALSKADQVTFRRGLRGSDTSPAFPARIVNTGVHWSADASRAAVVLDSGIAVYDLTRRAVMATGIGGSTTSRILGWTPADRYLAFEKQDGTMALWDFSSQREVALIDAPKPDLADSDTRQLLPMVGLAWLP